MRGNGPTVSHFTGDERTRDSEQSRFSNGIEHNDEGSPPPHPKRISPRNSELGYHSSETGMAALPQPNGIPGYSSDGLHVAPPTTDSSPEEPRERLMSVKSISEETRVLDEALSRTSTASLEGSSELAGMLQTEPERSGAVEGDEGMVVDRSNYEKLDSSTSEEDMETGGTAMATAEEEVRGKPTSYDAMLQDEDSHVR